MKNLLVVSHPDDEILGFGGTGHKLCLKGEIVQPVILCGQVLARDQKPKDMDLINDIKKANDYLGFNFPILGDFPNLKFNNVAHIEIVQFIEKQIDGVKSEPFETLVVDVPSEFSGKVIELVTQRKGDLIVMEPKGDLQHLEFYIPSRGLIGLRNNMLTATSGQAIMTHRFREFSQHKGDIHTRMKGSLISMEQGSTKSFALNRLQDRGRFFVEATDMIYKGQVVGEHTKDNDLEVNLIKGKQLTNMRKSGSDDAMKISPKVIFSLEESMEYIKEDEYLEITPSSLRMRKIKY